MDFIKKSWKGVTVITGIIAVIISLTAFDARYAKSIDTKERFQIVEQNVDIKVQKLMKTMDLQQNIFRLKSITDQLMQVKIQLRNHPTDQDLKEDYEKLKQEKEKIELEIERSAKER
jgi:hypothetical protein